MADQTPDAAMPINPLGAECVLQERSVNPLELLFRHLRGRYRLAMPPAGVLGLGLGLLGWFILPPEYTSTGLINVAPTRSYILQKNEFTERMTSYDSFV